MANNNSPTLSIANSVNALVANNPGTCITDLWERVVGLAAGDKALEEAAIDELIRHRGACDCDCDDTYCAGGYRPVKS